MVAPVQAPAQAPVQVPVPDPVDANLLPDGMAEDADDVRDLEKLSTAGKIASLVGGTILTAPVSVPILIGTAVTAISSILPFMMTLTRDESLKWVSKFGYVLAVGVGGFAVGRTGYALWDPLTQMYHTPAGKLICLGGTGIFMAGLTLTCGASIAKRRRVNWIHPIPV